MKTFLLVAGVVGLLFLALVYVDRHFCAPMFASPVAYECRPWSQF
jgi:hypothetical protein